ncbi:L,D-transpeptidase family protein [Holophaga foetida]|uniref:L,D-transpeptidase family protein n=1 Tax=Holophaga foetida TaxID=35839 RepID=UPI0002475071|nr:L,D-transpeptidase family protein [Holophaga foetida]
MSALDPIAAVSHRALALEGLRRPASPFHSCPPRLLVADVKRQRIGLLAAGELLGEFPISTALAGLGSEDGSFRTPLGWHRIHARVGEGATPGTVFRERLDTGEIWRGERSEADLILTRVLTLEGLEEGVNRGPGLDTLARYIYIHGTNREDQLGTPVSHGCLRMANADVISLFDLVREGDPLLISDGSGDALGLGPLHFAGVAGSGMSALAQFLAMRGLRVTGSDRSFDRGQRPEAKAQLERLGIRILPQDGSGVVAASGVVYSTAVEEEVPDFAEARRLGVPLVHRSELLAHLVGLHRTIAITGTSGKSTTTAMVFELLRGAGKEPSVITGGELPSLQREGLWGNAWAGGSDLLVIEADESDGTVVRYHPAVGVILNLQKDHKEPESVAELFRVFRAQAREAFVVGDDSNLAEFAPGAIIFGQGERAKVRAEEASLTAEGSSFRVRDTWFHLPAPGRHNLENALAAIAACRTVGVPLLDMVAPLEGFQGVARRFQVLGERRGVQVVDDFGHNPAKVAASIRTARLRAHRVLAVYQPHGYAPTRFLRKDFVETFATEIRPQDRFWMLEIFFAGGSAQRDFSSGDLVEEIAARGVAAEFAPSREWLVQRLASEAREGDLILVMGARDPSLTELAQRILQAL